MKAFINMKFSCYPLNLMLHGIRLNNRINRIHERTLRIVYQGKLSIVSNNFFAKITQWIYISEIFRLSFLLVAFCSLLLVRCPLLFPRCSWVFVRCLLLFIRCSLLFVCCLLLFTWCSWLSPRYFFVQITVK